MKKYTAIICLVFFSVACKKSGLAQTTVKKVWSTEEERLEMRKAELEEMARLMALPIHQRDSIFAAKNANRSPKDNPPCVFEEFPGIHEIIHVDTSFWNFRAQPDFSQKFKIKTLPLPKSVKREPN